jgi:hypothetical protein
VSPPYAVYITKPDGKVQGWFEQLQTRPAGAGKTPK